MYGEIGHYSKLYILTVCGQTSLYQMALEGYCPIYACAVLLYCSLSSSLIIPACGNNTVSSKSLCEIVYILTFLMESTENLQEL